MHFKNNLYFIVILCMSSMTCAQIEINARNTLVWGPGLLPNNVVLPARYFFIHPVNNKNEKLTKSPGKIFDVVIVGTSEKSKRCQVWINHLDRQDGSFIIRYKLYYTCNDFEIHVKYNGNHIAKSPYKVSGLIQPEHCYCPNESFSNWMGKYGCNRTYSQIERDLSFFEQVNFTKIRKQIIQEFNSPQSMSFCNYVIKNNKVYRNCYGQHVGFKMFIDAILLSLTRKSKLPDIEMFINLGDWPLVKALSNETTQIPMFSWCGSDDSKDIVMPTYDITESTLENMGRVMLDMLSVQGNSANIPWIKKESKVFWRGRDSRRERLTLIDIARMNPELFNVSLTNFFFFRDEESNYGPKSKHVSFFEFFNYKYQLNIDGTVAAYRFPYLLAGDSLVFKQNSKYYEFFYKDLQPWSHYIPVQSDLSDLVEKIQWAIENDDKARKISITGQKYARENLLPHDIICYHATLLQNWSKRILSPVEILDGMENVPQPSQEDCHCPELNTKDEL